MTRIKMKAKFEGKCNYCLKTVAVGTDMFYDPDHKAVFHPACKDQPWVQVIGRYQVQNSRTGRKRRGPRIITTAMRG